jgi:hypothetical protein
VSNDKLQEIKSIYDYAKKNGCCGIMVDVELLGHVVEQLEQAQSTNQKLVEALKFYENIKSYGVNVTDQWAPVTPVLVDSGHIARQALSQYTNTSNFIGDKEG